MARYDDLKGKRVVVTGGASGIGLATAKRFLREGCKVVIIDIDKDSLNKVSSKTHSLVGGIKADVSNPDEVSSAFKNVDELMGGVDILISNAGISIRKPFLEIDYEQWMKVINVNLTGMFLCAREAVKRMEKQGSGGYFIHSLYQWDEGTPFLCRL